MGRVTKSALATFVIIMSTAVPAFATIVNVGGGTWNYGTSYVFPTGKHVWSNYVHNSKYHSATSICASQQSKVFANATVWANSSRDCSSWDGAAEYWATY